MHSRCFPAAALAFAFAAPTGAMAADWYRTGFTGDAVAYTNAASYQLEADTIIVWEKIINRVPTRTQVKKTLSRVRYNCKEGFYQTLTPTAYDRAGSVLWTNNALSERSFPPPETAAERMMNFICKDTAYGVKIDDTDNDAALQFASD